MIGTAWNINGVLENALFDTRKGYPVDINDFKSLVFK